jgi:hypothetical protein
MFRESPKNEGRARRWRSLLVAVALCLPLLGCFEDPVEETVELCFPGDGNLGIRLGVSFHDEADNENAALEHRLAAARGALQGGYGEWHERFDRLSEPLLDGASWTRHGGRLESYERWGVVEDAAGALGDFFADVPVESFYLEGVREQPSELAFYPTVGDRASNGERQEVEARLRELSAALATHYRASHAVFSYVRANPARAGVVLELLLEDLVDRPEGAERPEPSEREAALLKAVRDAEEPILGIFEVDDDEAFTLQELSRRVFDPLPAELLVRVQGEVIEVVGFEQAEGGYRAERKSLWDAIAGLEGLFLSHDPLVAKVQYWMSPGEESEQSRYTLDDFLGDRAIYSSAPLASEVRVALLAELVPEVEYRLTWIAAEGEEPRLSGQGPGSCVAP